jgi:RNA polymerase sigma factor (sigma-70 family)
MQSTINQSRTDAGRLAPEAVARLVQRAAAGDQSGWDALVEEFGGMIWAVARAHRLSRSDASDVSQATWLRLLEHLTDLNDPARVGAWLATTARRECLRVLRLSDRQIPCQDDFFERQATGPPPDNTMLMAERDACLWRSFERLKSSDRALLRLLMADPRPPYREIAAALDMPIGSIGPTRARALERLRDELDREGTLELLIA